MKILVSVKNFYPFYIGGAEISLHTLLNELSKSHEVFVVCSGKNNSEFEENNIKIATRRICNKILGFYYPILFLNLKRWEKVVVNQINKIKPNLILTQLDFAAPSIFVANEFGIPSILFLRSYEHFFPGGYMVNNLKECNRDSLKSPLYLHHKLFALFIKKIMSLHEVSIKTATLLIANSNFVACICESFYGKSPPTICPFIKLENYISKGHNKRDKITLIGFDKKKGIDIFIKIANEMPEYNFQVIGKPRNSWLKFKFLVLRRKLKNVDFIQSNNDMISVYANTKILLAPSLWEEPFGRICVEAMANGIPSIVTKRGGLPETVGRSGIVINDPFDIASWINSIRKLMNDQSLYEDLSRRCALRAKGYSFDITFRNFVDLVHNKINLSL